MIHLPYVVMAAESQTEARESTPDVDENYDWTQDEGLTNTFYIPKSRFQSSYTYEKYCQQMYNQGYMDESYNWTLAAQRYINNMSVETYNALDEDARELVKEHIEDGSMKPEDSPYITAEEKARLTQGKPNTDNNETSETTASPKPSEPNVTPEINDEDDANSIDKKDDATVNDEKQQKEDSAQQEKGGISVVIERTLMALFVLAVVLIGYYIYRRQF